MSDIQIYLLDYEKNRKEARGIAANTAQKLETKQLKLIDLITSLEEYLNNKDDSNVRARSINFLADVLENVPAKILSGQERRLLVDFLLGRIEGDMEGIGAASHGLIALEKLGKWDSELAQKVATTYFSHAYPLRQIKLQMDRFAIIQLFDLLMAKYRASVRQLHESDSGFMPNFISYFEGEKDPRNLMIVFSILKVPMTEWNIRKDAQDLFEAVFNYFPITFKPPPDDPYGITAQDLKGRLRACIAANSDFAPHSIPALLDKLDSTSSATKVDVLQTLQACIVSYGPKTLGLYSVPLWDALKFEILNVQEEALAEDALKALALISETLASNDSLINQYLRPIIKECNEHLEDAPTTKSHAAGRILQAITGSAPIAADKIVKGVGPTLLTLYQSSNAITKRRGLLEVFNQITFAYGQLDLSRSDLITNEALKSSVPDALEDMLQALTSAPKSEVSFRLAALYGIVQLSAVNKLLSEKEINRVIDTIVDITLHEATDGHGDIKSDAIKALIDISRHMPNEICNKAVPAFMVELPDVPSEGADWSSALEAFTQLSLEQQVFDTIVLRLKNKLNAAHMQQAPADYQRALLLATLYAFTQGSPQKEDGIIRTSYFADFVAPLVMEVKNKARTNQTDDTLAIVGRLCNVVLAPQGSHFHASIYNANLDWFSPTQLPNVTPAKIGSLAPFSLYYYAALRPEVVDSADITLLLNLQAQYVLDRSTDTANEEVVLQHLSVLVNKFISPGAMRITLASARIEVKSLLEQHENNSKAIAIAFAVMKALIIQGKCGALTTEYLQILLALVPQDTDKSIARRFVTLLAPDELLTKDNHCAVSRLHKQKVFSSTIPTLVDSIRSTTDPAIKTSTLIVLSGILTWIPYSVLQSSLSTLFPPLLQTLDLPDAPEQAVKATTLTIFEATLMHDPDLAAEHAASLISRLLSCTVGHHLAVPVMGSSGSSSESAVTNDSATVRAKALLCLALVPQRIKREKVLPFRRRVIQRLLLCLDDAKRNVRGEAVRCRRAWLGLEEDDE